MNAGRLVESGTHDQLVAKEDGAYKALVDAQAFIEADEDDKQVVQKATTSPISPDDLHRAASYKSTNSSQAFAASGVDESHKLHSVFYLFKRMGKINADQKRNYFLGIVGATVSGLVCVCCQKPVSYADQIHRFPVFSIVFGQSQSVYCPWQATFNIAF